MSLSLRAVSGSRKRPGPGYTRRPESGALAEAETPAILTV
jgi:hypothetical protein